jgi:hypothetical protein
MGIIAQIMLLSQGAATVPPGVLVHPPTLPVIEDARLVAVIEDGRALTIIEETREVPLIPDSRGV